MTITLRWIQHAMPCFFFLAAAASQQAWADCTDMPGGQKITLMVSSCQDIVGNENKEVQQLAETVDLQRFYTGALIKDQRGSLWMYPSAEKNACKHFPNGGQVEKKSYSTCCDSGRWGKCVFGGRFLSDVDAKPINAFQ